MSVVLRACLVALLPLSAAGCTLAAGIFKAGFWVGIIFAALIVVALLMLFRRRW